MASRFQPSSPCASRLGVIRSWWEVCLQSSTEDAVAPWWLAADWSWTPETYVSIFWWLSSGVPRWSASGFAHAAVTLLRLMLPFPLHHKRSQPDVISAGFFWIYLHVYSSVCRCFRSLNISEQKQLPFGEFTRWPGTSPPALPDSRTIPWYSKALYCRCVFIKATFLNSEDGEGWKSSAAVAFWERLEQKWIRFATRIKRASLPSPRHYVCLYF